VCHSAERSLHAAEAGRVDPQDKLREVATAAVTAVGLFPKHEPLDSASRDGYGEAQVGVGVGVDASFTTCTHT
jgi:hypothetical protein